MLVRSRPKPHFLSFCINPFSGFVLFRAFGVVDFRRTPSRRKSDANFSFSLFLSFFLFLNLLSIRRRSKIRGCLRCRRTVGGLSTGHPLFSHTLAIISPAVFRHFVYRTVGGLSAFGHLLDGAYGEQNRRNRHAIGRHFFDHVGNRRHVNSSRTQPSPLRWIAMNLNGNSPAATLIRTRAASRQNPLVS